MNVKTTFNTQKVLSDFEARKRLAQNKLNAAVIGDSNVFCPMDQGVLKSSARVAPSKKAVEWNTPYAAPTYYRGEESISTQKNPKARPKWFESAKAINKDNWTDIVSSTLKGGA